MKKTANIRWSIIIASLVFVAIFTNSWNVSAQSVSITYGTPCVNSEMVFTLTGASCTSYSWTITNATAGTHYQVVSGATSAGFRVRWLQAVSGVFATCTYSCTSGSGSRSSSTLTVSNAVTPSVSISASANNVCQGTSVSFTAAPTNGGTTPTYQWEVNTVSIPGATGSTFSSSTLNNGDQVRVWLNSNAPCNTGSVVSSPITMTINTPAQQSITISSNKTAVCTGEGIQFNVTTESNIGTSPTYQWFVDGVAQTTDVPAMGQKYFIKNAWSFPSGAVVTCKVTSTLVGCTTTNPATSNGIPITINPSQNFTANISILPSKYPLTYCEDEISFQANTSHPASSYVWTKYPAGGGAGQIVATTQTYNPVYFQQGDYVTVAAYPTSTVCLSNTSATATTQGTPLTIFTDLSGIIINSQEDDRCQGSGTTQFTYTGTIPSPFTWNLLNAGSSTINQTGLVTWASNFSGTATVEIRLISCPSIFASKSFNVNALPPTPNAITQTNCNFEYIQLTPAPTSNIATFELYSNTDVFLDSGTEFSVGRKLTPGTYTYKLGALSPGGCPSPAKATITVTVTDNCDDKLNWIESTAYGPGSQIIGQSKSYFDLAGKPLQSQTKNLSTGKIFTSGVVKDQYDRIAASSLAAPTSSASFKYDILFMLDASGAEIADYNDLNSPQAFSNSSYGKAGWYYSSSNNIEENVPLTNYPYTRTKYYEDGTGEVMMTAAPGEYHFLGSGHEVLSGTFPVMNELDEYLQIRNSSVLPGQSSYSTLKQKGVQQVMRDENGKFVVSITDLAGKTLMTARAGNLVTIPSSVTLKKGDAAFIDRLYFYVLTPRPVTLTPSGGATYVVTNLLTNQPYAAPANGQNWAQGFYRIDITSTGNTLAVAYSNSFSDISYSFYDDAGRVVSTISPNGYQQLKVNNPAVPYSSIDKTTYVYNHRGWLMSMTEPDAGRTEYMYRSDGKIRFSQNALQRERGRFSFTHYDELGRPIQSGEYTGTTEIFGSVALKGKLEYANQAIWTSTDIADWSRTYYDLPENTDSTFSNLNLPAAYQGTLPYTQLYVRGAVAATENANIKTWYSYDELGRVRWMVQKPTALTRSFVVEYTYDFFGSVTTVVQKSFEGNNIKDIFYHHYEYDADRRLTKAFTSLDGVNKTQQAKYIYYMHGPLKRIELANNLQGIDFVYNIHGWLESINHPLDSKDPGKDGLSGSHSNFRKDVFGMTLDYFNSEFANLYQGADAGLGDLHNIHRLPQLESEDNRMLTTQIPYFKMTPAFRKELISEATSFKSYSAENPRYKELIMRSQNQQLDLSLQKQDMEAVNAALFTPPMPEEYTASLDSKPVVTEEEAFFMVPNYTVTWKDLVGVTANGSDLVKTAANGWGNAGAASQNVLASGADGYIEFPSYSTNYFMVGLSDVNTDAHYTAIDYAIFSNGSTSYIYENGTQILSFATVHGDLLRIERVGSSILYKKNGTILRTKTSAITGSLMIDVAMYSQNGTLTGVTSTFWIPSTPTPNPSFDIVWTDLVGVSVNGNTITKTAASGWGTGGAASVNALPANVDGWVEYTLDVLNVRRTFGLSDVNTDANYTTVDYGWYTNSNSVYVHLNGVNQTNVVAQVGDILRVERVGASIYFKRNGTTVFTVASGFTGAMIADASINELGTKISNAKASFWIPPAQGLVPDIHEFAALKDFYDSLGGAGWTTKTNWPAAGSWPATATATQMDTWFGIDILNGDISLINFSANNMVGKIPSKIGNLKGLINLTVTGNVNITGSVPSSIGNLTLLTSLKLNNNKLSGGLPATLGNLTKLSILYLHGNNLSGTIPAAINQLILLQDLRLANNLFTGLLPNLGSLINLIYLDLSNNSQLTLAAIPTWIGNLTNLQNLQLSASRRNGTIPNEIQNLTNLRYLYLSSNQLTGSLPVGIGSLSNLIQFYINNNSLSGTITTDFSGLVNLTHLYFYSNQFTGPIPSSINKMVKLQNLQLQSNSFTGAIPYLGDLSDLNTLNLSSNTSLSPGAIPDWIGNLSKLIVLNLASTNRNGAIPASLANLAVIDNLLLNDNQLSGTVPTYMGTFTKLKYLYLHNNQLTGDLPANWNAAVLLYYLSISGNKFTGAIPSSLLSLPALVYVYVHGNDFTSIPNFNSAVNKLNMYINVSNNRLDFTTLEPNYTGTNTHVFKALTTSPQKNFADVTSISTPLNSQLEIPARAFTALNTITWEKLVNAVWTNVSASNQNSTGTTYRINPANGTYAGSYRYKLTSTKITALTLYSDPITVGITDVYNQQATYITGLALYNGNITSLAWRTDAAYASGGTELKGMYLYKYDEKYQLQEAQFANPTFGALTSSYVLEGNKFRENGLTYDPNGNLLTLKRYNEGQHKVHDFTYSYEALKNTNLISNADATSTTGFTAEGSVTLSTQTVSNQTYVKAVTSVATGSPGIRLWSTSATPGDKYTFRVQGYEVSNGNAFVWVSSNVGNIVWLVPSSQFPSTASAERWVEVEFTVPAGATTIWGGVLFSTGFAVSDAIYINRAELFKSQARSNRLASVSGYVNAYSYNAIGQMIGQDNVTGTDMYVNYDVTGKVTHVYADLAKTILTTRYLYDDRGFRLAKETYNTSGVLQFTTWYVRDASGNVLSIYNQNAGQPQVTLTEVTVYGSGKLGLYRQKLDGGYEYIYELTDHLGNVRATIKEDEDVYLATMEDTGIADWNNPRVREMQYFKNLFETEKRDNRMNHTPSSTDIGTPERSAYLYWVDDGVAATREDIIGPAIALKVDAGDTINLETWAKFERKVSYTRNATTAMMATLLGSGFVNASFGLENLSVANQTFTNNLPTALAGTGSDPATRPFAYLNYIVFDESYVLKDAGAWRVPDNAGFDPGMEIAVLPQKVAFPSPIKPQQKGYIYIWVSNESQATKVWFDDLKVTHRGKRVTQATDYYAHGSVLREQRTPDESIYRYKYQGQYAEKDEETGWSHFELREYEPVVGRWTSKDPAGQYYSPFIGMGNNPISGVDPDGAFKGWFGAFLYKTFNGGGDISYNSEGDFWQVTQMSTEMFEGKEITGVSVIAGRIPEEVEDPFKDALETKFGTTIDSKGEYWLAAFANSLEHYSYGRMSNWGSEPGPRFNRRIPGGRMNMAGKVHPKTGVSFDKDGFPDFSKNLYKGKNDVMINPNKNRLLDEAAANKAAGYESTPNGYTWHHHQQRGRMQLVETGVHRQTGHTGGFSIWE